MQRLLESDSKKILRTAGVKAALELMENDSDIEAFRDVKDSIENEDLEAAIKSRFPAGRQKASAYTPEAIKSLRPPAPGCTICWQFSESSFEGYYQIPDSMRSKAKNAKKLWSRSRSYGGGKWTRSSALTQIVNFLWTQHKLCQQAEASAFTSACSETATVTVRAP